jgi:Zn-finger nucleic acid-binding protein
MQCPTDGTTLVMSERSGIEIDYCPQCRGVWLDRGELDKIIDRAGNQEGEQGAWANPPAQPQSAPAPRYAASGGYHPGASGQGYYKKKRRESWLSELFD